LPEAVTMMTGTVPSVYMVGFLEGKRLTFKASHGLNHSGKLCLVDESCKQFDCGFIRLDDLTLQLDLDHPPEQLFVYGTAVDDFHTVDYDQIFTLTTSALQEVDREVVELRERVKRLEDARPWFRGLNRERQAMRDLEERLRRLEEAAASAVGQK